MEKRIKICIYKEKIIGTLHINHGFELLSQSFITVCVPVECHISS